MYMDDDGRRPSLTPQLALRVAVVGGIALVAFGVVFFRLWYLQVLSGDKYRAEANDNRVREIKVQAPRGEIVDRNGKVLVNNRTGLAVRVTPKTLPGQARGPARRLPPPGPGAQPVGRRGSSGGWTASSRRCPTRRPRSSRTCPQKTVYYLFENQEDFPGVTVEQEFLREYPHRQVGAQLFGFVREATKEQLDDKQRYRGVGPRRPRRPVRHRIPVRPLPARPQRRQPGAGGRAGQPARPAAQPPARAGPPAAAVAGPRRPAGGPERPGRRARRVRGHERARRPGARRWAARPRSTPTSSPRSCPSRPSSA